MTTNNLSENTLEKNDATDTSDRKNKMSRNKICPMWGSTIKLQKTRENFSK